MIFISSVSLAWDWLKVQSGIRRLFQLSVQRYKNKVHPTMFSLQKRILGIQFTWVLPYHRQSQSHAIYWWWWWNVVRWYLLCIIVWYNKMELVIRHYCQNCRQIRNWHLWSKSLTPLEFVYMKVRIICLTTVPGVTFQYISMTNLPLSTVYTFMNLEQRMGVLPI